MRRILTQEGLPSIDAHGVAGVLEDLLTDHRRIAASHRKASDTLHTLQTHLLDVNEVHTAELLQRDTQLRQARDDLAALQQRVGDAQGRSSRDQDRLHEVTESLVVAERQLEVERQTVCEWRTVAGNLQMAMERTQAERDDEMAQLIRARDLAVKDLRQQLALRDSDLSSAKVVLGFPVASSRACSSPWRSIARMRMTLVRCKRPCKTRRVSYRNSCKTVHREHGAH